MSDPEEADDDVAPENEATVEQEPVFQDEPPAEEKPRRVMLEVDAIHTFYGESHVLHGASLRVQPGEVVALLGRNGSGKTTLVRSIVGFEHPRSGRIAWEGSLIHRLPPHAIARPLTRRRTPSPSRERTPPGPPGRAAKVA